MLYLIAIAIGFVIAKLLLPPPTSPFFNDVVMKNIKEGKRVSICVGNEATIFEMIENRIKITRGTMDFMLEDEDGNVVDSGGVVESNLPHGDVH